MGRAGTQLEKQQRPIISFAPGPSLFLLLSSSLVSYCGALTCRPEHLLPCLCSQASACLRCDYTALELHVLDLSHPFIPVVNSWERGSNWLALSHMSASGAFLSTCGRATSYQRGCYSQAPTSWRILTREAQRFLHITIGLF